MNIGITCYPTVGGSGAVAAELGKQLARRGHSVHFVSYRLPFRLDEFQDNVRYHEIDLTTYSLFEYPPHDLALAAKMAEVARDNKLDLFHVHYAIPHAITGILAQQMLGGDAAGAQGPQALGDNRHGRDGTQNDRQHHPAAGFDQFPHSDSPLEKVRHFTIPVRD